jgi:hypothetical protein
VKISISFFPTYSPRTRKISMWTFLLSPSKCSHGPKTWPRWWHRFSISVVRLAVAPPSTGYGIWIYTRRGGRCIDVYFDRREPIPEAA